MKLIKDKVRVLVTGAGAPGGPGIIKCLQKDNRISLIAGDMNDKASGRFLVDNFIHLKSADNPDFLNHIIEVCNKNSIDVIFPLVTRELFVFSKHIDEFRSLGIQVVVSPWSGLHIANDKIALYKHLHAHGVSVPSYRVATNANELIEAAKSLGYPSCPVVMKPGISNGSRGIRILDQSINRYDLLFNYKPNGVISTLDEILTIIGDYKIPDLLVSEYLPGDEVTVDTIVSCRGIEIILPRVREKMSGGISVAGHFIDSNEINCYVSSILHTLDLFGPIGLQVKLDNNGQFKLLEINPRIQGTSVAAMGCGVNLPLISVGITAGWQLNIPAPKKNVGFVRYYEEAFYDINAI